MSDKIAKLKEQHAKQLAATQREIEILESLPIEPYSVFISGLYNVSAWVKYSGLENLRSLIEAYPALPMVKTAKGSSFLTVMPEMCTDSYKQSVTGWENMGSYAVRLSTLKYKYWDPQAKIYWYTVFNGQVLKIKVNLDAIASELIAYTKLDSREQRSTGKKYGWQLCDRWKDFYKSNISYISYWASEPGLNGILVYSKDNLSPDEMIKDLFDA